MQGGYYPFSEGTNNALRCDILSRLCLRWVKSGNPQIALEFPLRPQNPTCSVAPDADDYAHYHGVLMAAPLPPLCAVSRRATCPDQGRGRGTGWWGWWV